MKERGMSGVVAIVLIILMAVAGVGIIWGVILPFLDADVRLSENAVSIDTSGGFTSYDEAQGIACVQVVRNDEEIDGLKIIFIIRGGSHTVSILKDDLVDANSKKRYCVNLSSYGVPSSVTVVPIREGEDGVGTTYDIPHSPFSPGAYATIVGGGLKYVDDDPENPDNLEWILLDKCAVLDIEGEEYRLKGDLIAQREDLVGAAGDVCFLIEADDIIFNLNGKKMSGETDIQAISALNVDGLKINNGEIEKFSSGVVFIGVSGSTLEDLSVLQSYENGIYFDGSNENILRNLEIDTTIKYNADGIELRESDFNVLEGIVVRNSEDEGIEVEAGSNNTFTSIGIYDSGGNGFKIGGTGPSGVANDNVLDDVEIYRSESDGLELSKFSWKNRITNLISNENIKDGVKLDGSGLNKFEDIFTVGNHQDGFDLEKSGTNIFVNIIIEDNGGYGLYTQDRSDSNKFDGLNSTGNSLGGVYIGGSVGNDVKNFFIMDNNATSSVHGLRFTFPNNIFSDGVVCGSGGYDVWCGSSLVEWNNVIYGSGVETACYRDVISGSANSCP